jgi:Uma2 family endonuclease
MDIYMPMATTERHNKFTGTIFGRILGLLEKNELRAWNTDGALVYLGSRKENGYRALVDIENFNKRSINELEYIQPDFMLFQKNKCYVNKNGTRVAGYPDLVVEIWSIGNDNQERMFKKDLYSTSNVTEQWYISQNSNIVECYMGSKKSNDKCLTEVLVSKHGIEFDLRYLAL